MHKSIWIGLAVLMFVAAAVATPTSESLLIGPGDLVHVQILDTPELEQQSRVTDGGTIGLIAGGDVKLAGLTPSAGAHAIESALKERKMLRNPRALVTVVEYATQKVSVLGEVKIPGAYAIGTPRSVLQVLALAGGINEVADRKILVQRAGSMEKIPYFIANEPNAAADTAVQVNPGDTILVPRAALAYALGDFKMPGAYTMTNNDGKLTLLELVARARGTTRTAAEGRLRLIRKTDQGYVDTQLSLRDIEKGKQPDIQLQADDIVYAPFSIAKGVVVSTRGILQSAGTAAIYHF